MFAALPQTIMAFSALLAKVGKCEQLQHFPGSLAKAGEQEQSWACPAPLLNPAHMRR